MASCQLQLIEDYLEILLEQIQQQPELQSDQTGISTDIHDAVMDIINSDTACPNLASHYLRLIRSLYEAKGSLSETVPEILQLKDFCFERRLYLLLSA